MSSISSSASCSQQAGAPVTKKRAPAHNWTEEETRTFLSLMSGKDGELGYFNRIKQKKLERMAAMRQVCQELKAKGIDVMAEQVDNKWKSLLSRYRTVEDHNAKSGNSPMAEGLWHADMAVIMGHRASTRPVSVTGSGIPIRSLPSSPLIVGSPSGSDASSSPVDDELSLPPSPVGGKRRAREVSGLDLDDDDVEGSSSGTGKATTPVKKLRRTSSPRSRTSDILKWADAYQESERENRRQDREAANARHREKLGILERLVSALEKKY